LDRFISEIDSRQRVNLSEHAQEIIVSDLLDFEGEKPAFSGAVSKIFLAYYRQAKHDPDSVETYTSIKPSIHIKQAPRLQNKVIKVLERNGDILKGAYGGSVGRFVKSVIEQYAELPYSERSLSYFSKAIKNIETAIKNKERISIETAEGWHSMRPYCIDADKVTAHNYLVGYTKNEDGDEVPNVFRLSRILNVENDGPGELSKREIDLIKEAIKKRGVPFLRNEPQIVKIRLTGNGQKLYSRLIHNRPVYEKKDGDTLIFSCTATQIEYYFFKFGADAEVIEPASLRDRFKSMYKTALERYQ
jgi:hypothetical protein